MWIQTHTHTHTHRVTFVFVMHEICRSTNYNKAWWQKKIHAITTISMACACESKVCCFNSLQYLQLEKAIIWMKYISKNVKSNTNVYNSTCYQPYSNSSITR